MWQTTKWLEASEGNLGEEDITWWPLLLLLTDGSNTATKDLTKCLVAAWRWMAKVSTMPPCPPAPTMLDIRKLLDECPKEGDHTPWLLAYARVLQCMGEATDGRMWHPSGVRFTPQISLLVYAFIEETGAELMEADIASCWGQLLEEVLQQKDDGPFAEVISHLDELAWYVPSRKAWDVLVFPPPLAEPSAPHQGGHLRYIMGHTVDLGSCLPPLWFHVTGPNGEFICVAQGLLFEGSVLAYDPASNGAEWVLMRGTASDLSPAEDASAQELSNITIPDAPEDVWRLDHFRECQEGCDVEAPAKAFCTCAALCKKAKAMEQVLPDREEVGSKSSEESKAESEGSKGGLEEPAEEPTEEPV